MTEKEKIHMEFVFKKVSKNILWNYITTPNGLAEWFADDVSFRNNDFIFTWDKSSQEAEQIACVNLVYVRFKWKDEEDPAVYFEFRIHTEELTGDTALEITDFVSPDEVQHTTTLWDSQIKILKRTLGV